MIIGTIPIIVKNHDNNDNPASISVINVVFHLSIRSRKSSRNPSFCR